MSLCSMAGYILTAFVYILTPFWLHSDYIPTIFNYIPASFWLHSGYILEYIPPPGPTGPTDKCKIAYNHNWLALSFRKYAWHKTSSIIEYIPPPGPIGPTDRQTKLHISTIIWPPNQFSENILCTQHPL